jgi:hypothetical protein
VRVPPFNVSPWDDAATIILDRVCIHVRARVPALSHMTLGELAAIFGGLRDDIDRVIDKHDEGTLELMRDDE